MRKPDRLIFDSTLMAFLPAFVVSALFLLAFVVCVQIGWRLTRDSREPVPPMIGTLIRLLIILQAAFCAATGEMTGTVVAAMLIVLWPISRAVGRRFYAS